MPYQIIDPDRWSRAEYLKFFKGMSHPWYNICTHLDVTVLYQHCKANKQRFFHAYLYLMQQAINQCKPMRYRLVNDSVHLYEKLNISIAILADDDSIRFCNLPYEPQFTSFSHAATSAEIEIKQTPFILTQFIGQEMRHDTIHMTVLPWLNFTSMSHARDTKNPDSIPKIALGKLTHINGHWQIPLSIEVHHGMMDGLHVGKFIAILQALFNQPELLN
ncbi:MAG: CatA-like O-acetyltransferase [Moritella sp.]|uniref:CatA-like O-acetyltransferase n=1 Tax=Moritella sp. TaxID=78556 RepID=UPI0029B93931|nr:CatA-like O-acetyltransferase [Moritella sp.]MDX2319542.1 CatA-like O-acetyltransferase [Moritella sp.]